MQCSRVLELSDRFLEVRNNGVWLVMFYAPWCGHCKTLEPIWNQVAQSLVDTNIRVGRLDCTRFTSVATEFSVRGFPTILFIKGHKTVEYKGDRLREDIVAFARRMDGPSVSHLTSCEQIKNLRKEKSVFFIYVNGEKPEEDNEMKDTYTRISEEFQPVMYFYTAPTECVKELEAQDIPQKQSVYVCKDNSCFQYDEDILLSQNLTLYDWVNRERFPTFMKVTNGNFHQLVKAGKYIAMAILEENQIGKISLKMQEFRDMVEAIALSNRDRYSENFIFGWLGHPDIANSVAMMTLPVPSFIIVNAKTYQYYLPPEDEKIPTPQSILALLDQVMNNSSQAYGGDTLYYRIYRAYYEAKTSLWGMWRGNPVLTAVLLGLPLGLLCIICYTTCCNDILEAGDEDESEQQDTRHAKRE